MRSLEELIPINEFGEWLDETDELGEGGKSKICPLALFLKNRRNVRQVDVDKDRTYVDGEAFYIPYWMKCFMSFIDTNYWYKRIDDRKRVKEFYDLARSLGLQLTLASLLGNYPYGRR